MSTLVRWEPVGDLGALRGRMDRVFEDFFTRGWGGEEGAKARWNPAMDVYEGKEGIVLKADLPGMTEKDVDVSVEGNTLTIRGERKREEQVAEKEYYRVERSYGAFTRSFTVPNTVDLDKIQATFLQGTLQLTLPKRDESKPKQIKVKVNGESN